MPDNTTNNTTNTVVVTTNPIEVNKPWYRQKKLWAMVIGALISTATVIITTNMKFDFKTIVLLLIAELGPTLSYVLGQSVVDSKVYSAIAANLPTLSPVNP